VDRRGRQLLEVSQLLGQLPAPGAAPRGPGLDRPREIGVRQAALDRRAADPLPPRQIDATRDRGEALRHALERGVEARRPRHHDEQLQEAQELGALGLGTLLEPVGVDLTAARVRLVDLGEESRLHGIDLAIVHHAINVGTRGPVRNARGERSITQTLCDDRRARDTGGSDVSSRLKLLFVCSRNQWRSPTAERVFARDPELAVRSRGVSASAVRRLTGADVAWADVIMVMEADHKRQVTKRFRDELEDRPIHVLDIPDVYQFMDPELIELLETSVRAALALREDG
jgi:predicted protein tyrosine phosphatase